MCCFAGWVQSCLPPCYCPIIPHFSKDWCYAMLCFLWQAVLSAVFQPNWSELLLLFLHSTTLMLNMRLQKCLKQYVKALEGIWSTNLKCHINQFRIYPGLTQLYARKQEKDSIHLTSLYMWSTVFPAKAYSFLNRTKLKIMKIKGKRT